MLLFGCGQEAETNASDTERSGVIVKVSKVDEISDRINIYTIDVAPFGKASIDYNFGPSSTIGYPSSQGSFDTLIVAHLEQSISSAGATTEKSVILETSQYSDRRFSSTSRTLENVEEIRRVSIKNYIEGFKTGEFRLVEGERLMIGSIDNREFEISVLESP